jgi:hypothetical protein
MAFRASGRRCFGGVVAAGADRPARQFRTLVPDSIGPVGLPGQPNEHKGRARCRLCLASSSGSTRACGCAERSAAEICRLGTAICHGSTGTDHGARCGTGPSAQRFRQRGHTGDLQRCAFVARKAGAGRAVEPISSRSHCRKQRAGEVPGAESNLPAGALWPTARGKGPATEATHAIGPQVVSASRAGTHAFRWLQCPGQCRMRRTVSVSSGGA